jgi:hypothetical protein
MKKYQIEFGRINDKIYQIWAVKIDEYLTVKSILYIVDFELVTTSPLWAACKLL